MNQVISFFKRIRLSQVLTAFVASILLFFTQACNSASAKAPKSLSQPSVGPNSETYVPKGDNIINPYEGGMNNFSDVDPRSKRAGSEAKAKAEYLKEHAQQNVQKKGVDSVEQYVENYRQGTPLPERVQNLGEDVGSSAKELTEGVTKGAQRGVENIKENVKSAGGYLKDRAQDTVVNPVENAR
jgi:hypothetical protein